MSVCEDKSAAIRESESKVESIHDGKKILSPFRNIDARPIRSRRTTNLFEWLDLSLVHSQRMGLVDPIVAVLYVTPTAQYTR